MRGGATAAASGRRALLHGLVERCADDGITQTITWGILYYSFSVFLPAMERYGQGMAVDGYVVEGHVPFDVIRRLLKERPQVAGIAVPGMPAGSPGMEVPSGRKDPYDIIAFTRDGQVSVSFTAPAD